MKIAGANIQESRSIQMDRSFTTSTMVDVPFNIPIEQLKTDIEELLPKHTILVFMKTPSVPNVFVAEFTAETVDNLGLVHELTRVFAAHNLNISMIDTEQTIAPFGGTTLFSMNGTITSEQPIDISQLKSDIKDLEHRIRIDVTLSVTMTSQS